MKALLDYIINKVDTVSFDVFDTLIERDVVKPSDIFKIVARNVLGDEFTEQFYEHRVVAEKHARQNKNLDEVTLNDIYNELGVIYGNRCSELMKNEIDTEIDSCHSKDKYVRLLNEAIENGKKVYLISDMYLSNKTIEAMLEKCNISGYDKLYVSSIYNANKQSGKLFDIVISENNIDVRKMVHIGDSFRADFWGAHKVGIKSILINRKYRLRRIL